MGNRLRGATRVTSATSRPWFSLTCRRRRRRINAYGSATVRPYVGAVKRVILPIVALAINRTGAPYFHSSRVDYLAEFRRPRGKALGSPVRAAVGRLRVRFLSSFRLAFNSTTGQAKQTCAALRRPSPRCELICGDCGDLVEAGCARTDRDDTAFCSVVGERETGCSKHDSRGLVIGAEAGQSSASLMGTYISSKISRGAMRCEPSEERTR